MDCTMERCSYGQSYGEVFLATIVWRGVFMNYSIERHFYGL